MPYNPPLHNSLVMLVENWTPRLRLKRTAAACCSVPKLHMPPHVEPMSDVQWECPLTGDAGGVVGWVEAQEGWQLMIEQLPMHGLEDEEALLCMR